LPTTTAEPDRTTDPTTTTPPSQDRPERLFLVWSPGGLVPNAEARLEARLRGANATTFVTGLEWLTDTDVGPTPPPGYAFPIDVAYVEPNEYSRLMGSSRLLEPLMKGTIVFGETGARSDDASEVTFGERRLAVSATVPAEQIQGYEAMLAAPAPRGWGASFLLVRTEERAPAIERVAAPLSDRPIAVVREGDAPYLRYAHSTSPQARFKEVLGEFAARPLPDGTVEIDPRWVARNIVEKTMPLLGRVRCHRRLFPQLRLALNEIGAQGLGSQVKTDQFAGCFSPRFIGRDPDGRLSAHSWGAAVDINAAENPLGRPPTMHDGVVHAFMAAGFKWGGEWLIPDGMHFEWARELGA
jgi:hypothetical protein